MLPFARNESTRSLAPLRLQNTLPQVSLSCLPQSGCGFVPVRHGMIADTVAEFVAAAEGNARVPKAQPGSVGWMLLKQISWDRTGRHDSSESLQ